MSVMMAEEGQIEHPSDVLDEMRERFMIHGTDLKKFVAAQVALAQSELEQLFLINGDEKREDVIPAFELRDLKDDPTQCSKGWSFY
ncbi:hypothetical protein SLS61_010163 [Didymella pomorum]